MSPKAALTARRLVERLREPLSHEVVVEGDLERVLTSPEAAAPGLVLAGFTGRFVHERVQVMGETEITYLGTLPPERRREVLQLFFSFPLPLVCVTKGLAIPEPVAELAAGAGIPVVRTPLKTAEFYRRINPVLEAEFAPSATIHGSLADVYGVGLLVTGPSGIGKSECVLDLVERGHRLVADDLVIATRRGTDLVIGRGHEMARHHMEIRGIGIIDIPSLFGIRAVRQQKRIEVVVRLEPWNQEAHVDRTGLDGEVTRVLDVELPLITVPLNPGKNLTVIAEVIAMNHLLRYGGMHTAESFNERLIARMRAKARDAAGEPAAPPATRADVGRYLLEDDE
ncbi:MAG: HPr(Ser) kinase/phosphatase [Gemmatimonadota bacterium]